MKESRQTEQIKQLASRIKYLREVLELSAEEAANGVGITTEEYLALEDGERDMPISLIYELASVFGVDPTELLTGDAPRADIYAVTRAGGGVSVNRYEGYSFEALAYNYIDRNKEPMLVRIAPSDGKPKLVSHDGQEFNYVLKGKIGVVINGKTVILNKGDSIYFDPSYPHGQFAVDEPSEFLTVIDI